jgi:colanic acid biosynthesis glycosyl transferase WcaI
MNSERLPQIHRPKLWVITELYYPEETSTGYYLTRIAEGLINVFDVSVICGQPNYSKRGTVAPQIERHNGVEIFRVAGTRLDKNVIPFRLMNMLTLGASVFLKAARKFQIGDQVLVVTTPPSMPFIVAIASLLKGASYTLLIHDNYPEMLVASNKTRSSSLLTRTVHYFNRWLYKHASRVIVVGRDMKELLEKKTEGLDIPIATIPNWAELETVEPLPRGDSQLLRELGLIDKFVLLYAGNMGHPNDLESIVGAAEALREDTDIHIIFLGSGIKLPWLQSEVAKKALTNVTVLPPKPRSEQPNFLNACDVAIVSLVSMMYGVSMPSRTYNALAAGKPILAIVDPGSEVARVVEEENVGWIVPPGNVLELAALIREIKESRERLGGMAVRARRSAVEKYSLETALENYREVLKPAPTSNQSRLNSEFTLGH